MADAPAALVAALRDRYQVERELGHGGMATVYLARDLKHNRPVAIKVLRPELAAALGSERFLREIELSARLTHPHILPLHDSGDAGGFLYYVMPYVEGESLRDRLTREKQLPLEDALRITGEVADALSYAHDHDIVHRDIKPENILLESGHAVVADFGIARAITAAGGDKLTETGLAVGTPAYMSPEQGMGEPQLDRRSDVYALGCVVYEMLAGTPPFTGSTAQAILARKSFEPVPSLRVVRETVPAPVEHAIQRALAKVPADRFATATQFAEALAQRESAAMSAAPTVPVRLARRSYQRVLFLVVGVLAVGSALLMLRLRREVPAPAQPVYPRTFIAVLPFQNLSAEGSQAYFAGGLHDELLTQLTKVAALQVISRTSVMGYQGTRKPIRQIAEELGVGSVVEGTVQVAGGRLRVNVQLIDAATDAHLWAERYDRRLDDAFAIQSEVAQQIVAAVGAALTGAEQGSLAAAPTANAEAYRLYLQGREYETRPGALQQNLQIAQRFYERALALDQGFSVARAALSVLHGEMFWFRYDPSPTRAARQREEAEAALRLAPNLPQAHVAMGLVHYWGRRDYRRALDEFAIALNGLPGDAALWGWIGAVQRRLGNWDDVLRAFVKATQLNARDARWFEELGNTFQVVHRYADAVRAYDRALSLAPDLYEDAIRRAKTYTLWQGQLDTLRAALSRVPRNVGDTGGYVDAQRANLLLWERDGDGLLQEVQNARFEVFDGQEFFLPRALYAAWAHQLRSDRPASTGAFNSAFVILDSALSDLPSDWRLHAARGMALAGLGRRDQALREAEWLRQSAIYREDAYESPHLAEDRAQILARAGDARGALDEIEQLLAKPSWLSVHMLRLDPRWDPIRDQPRFVTLLAKYTVNPSP
ncbi:MAG TPA: protein kinase [Gemmatimonadales bacterium]|nr:protein kinase [Gemmatimonadales bacterium]